MSVAEKTEKKSGGLGETVSVIVQALLLALVIRTLLFQPFSIPSGSMRPTLLEGDYLFVTKWAYGYSRHSLPFSPPIFSGRIWGSEPARGDVVVFKFPPNPSLDYIKRVIGLPGDSIQVHDGQLYHQRRAGAARKGRADRQSRHHGSQPSGRRLPRDAAEWRLLRHARPDAERHCRQHARVRRTGRPLFHDGRQPRQLDRQPFLARRVGFVPAENLVGRANIIFFSIADGASPLEIWRWGSVRLSRFLNPVH